MPSISSRMSGSSSTMRMSCAMRHLLLLTGHRSGGGLRRGTGRQDEAGGRAWPLRPIVEHEAAPVVLHDLLDDSQSQSRPLRFVRDVWLGQSRPIFLRKSDSVIGHGYANTGRIILDRNLDSSGLVAHGHRV